MVRTALALCVVISMGAVAHGASPGVVSVPRGTRSFYGTNFGNRYQYFGLGYGYPPGTPGVGSGFGYGGRYGGYGGYGRYGGYGGYGRSGGYGGYGGATLQLERLHEQQMMWSMQFAPIPETPPSVTINPYWNPYQSHLADDIYRRDKSQPPPETYENPYAAHPATHKAE